MAASARAAARAALGTLRAQVSRSPAFTDRKGQARNGVAGVFLGATAMLGLQLMLGSAGLSQLGAYVFCVSVFHILEFMMTAMFNWDTLSYDSWLLNHSREYHIAMAASVAEYFLELLVTPGVKDYAFISFFGFIITISGQALRTAAMATAKSNFSHQVAEEAVEGHVLVRSGVYRLSRHPAYSGWFLWALGTQLILVNPICFVGYTYVTWKFFENRIRVEEHHLMEFFPQEYPDYKAKVWSGVPGVSGGWIPKIDTDGLSIGQGGAGESRDD